MKKLFYLLMLTAAANVQAVELKGVLTQGGMATGVVTPGSVVEFENEPVYVGKDGRFFIGFERFAPVELTLKVTTAGKTETQKIIIEPRTYDVATVDGVPAKTVNPDPKQTEQVNREAAKIKKARQVMSEVAYLADLRFKKPVEHYRRSGVYGSRRVYNGEERSWHKGLDFAAPTGTPIHAPADGVVRLVLPNSFMNGNLVMLDHGYGVTTIYAHMSKISVHENDKIKAGQVIGAVGSTGRSSGPHLHMGLSWHNMALDPQLFLEE